MKTFSRNGGLEAYIITMHLCVMTAVLYVTVNPWYLCIISYFLLTDDWGKSIGSNTTISAGASASVRAQTPALWCLVADMAVCNRTHTKKKPPAVTRATWIRLQQTSLCPVPKGDSRVRGSTSGILGERVKVLVTWGKLQLTSRHHPTTNANLLQLIIVPP